MHISHVGLGINSSDFDLPGFNPSKSLLRYGTNRYGQLRIHSRIRGAFTIRSQKRLNPPNRKTYYFRGFIRLANLPTELKYGISEPDLAR